MDLINWNIRGLIGVGLAMMLTACATVIAPQGGVRDEIPPKVIQEKSTPNLQTNFKPKLIELTFNEWVQLNDWRNQVVISPPLSRQDFELKLKGKTVQVRFDEEVALRDSATYTINFGEAIQDLNEKNPAENLRFVFATGDILDSLSIRAKVLDAETNEPIEKALVMLYENQADSVVRTERPFYFGRTDQDGVAVIENIRADSFKLAVLVDSGNDYLFKQPGQEQFGFLNSAVTVSEEALDTIRISAFNEEIPLKLNDSDTKTFGLAKLIFNRDPYDLDTLFSNADLGFIEEQDKDTLKLWYTNPPDSSYWKILVQTDTSRLDTVDVKPFESTEVDSLKMVGAKLKSFNPAQPISIQFNQPIASWDTSLIRFYVDTLKILMEPIIELDSLNPRKLWIQQKWKEGFVYELNFDPGAVFSIFNQSHDSIQLALEADLLKQYGNIKLQVSGLDSTNQYILQLRADKKIERSLLINDQQVFQTELKSLKTGNYTLSLITDFNRDERWTTGNYDLKLQPEPIFLKKLEQLRANWDLEVEVQLK